MFEKNIFFENKKLEFLHYFKSTKNLKLFKKKKKNKEKDKEKFIFIKNFKN